MMFQEVAAYLPLQADFQDATTRWKHFRGKATYLLVASLPFGRLMGNSDILYVGSTEKLGGDDSSRLWNYRYGTTEREREIRDRSAGLINEGITVSLRWCTTPPNNLSVKEYEAYLLDRYFQEHLELPPWNHQRPKV